MAEQRDQQCLVLADIFELLIDSGSGFIFFFFKVSIFYSSFILSDVNYSI